VRSWWGRAWPSIVALLGTIAVVGALLVFFGRDVEPADSVSTAGSTAPSDARASGAATGEPTPVPTEVAPPVDVMAPVVVLNGSSVRGLAAKTGQVLTAAGWTVAATDNYARGLPATTVFYPAQLFDAAQTLARAFPKLTTLQPALEGMSADQLTLVLTGDVDLSES